VGACYSAISSEASTESFSSELHRIMHNEYMPCDVTGYNGILVPVPRHPDSGSFFNYLTSYIINRELDSSDLFFHKRVIDTTHNTLPIPYHKDENRKSIFRMVETEEGHFEQARLTVAEDQENYEKQMEAEPYIEMLEFILNHAESLELSRELYVKVEELFHEIHLGKDLEENFSKVSLLLEKYGDDFDVFYDAEEGKEEEEDDIDMFYDAPSI
jgi:hypothetical protein